jgi:hypothetical protein
MINRYAIQDDCIIPDQHGLYTTVKEVQTEIERLEKRIAELETAQTQSKQNYELEVAHWKRIGEDAQIRASVAILPSVMCSENHVQNCHCCDRLDCGDNTSEAKKRIAELEAALKRQESELRECEAFWKSQKTIKESR